MVKAYSSKEVDAMIVVRYRELRDTLAAPAFVSYEQLGKLFKCSGSHVRSLIVKRQRELRGEPTVQRKTPRKLYGIKWIREDQIAWAISTETLKAQVGLSLKDRCQLFHR